MVSQGHYSLFYPSLAPIRKILVPYFVEGLHRGMACYYFASQPMIHAMQGWLHEAGVEAAEALRSGQFVCSASLGDPAPRSVDEFLAGMDRLCRTALARYGAIREAGQCFDELSGFSPLQVAEAESRVNPLLAAYPITALCCYELSHLSGATLLHLLQTHPSTIGLDGVKKNPYLRPEAFLERLHPTN